MRQTAADTYDFLQFLRCLGMDGCSLVQSDAFGVILATPTVSPWAEQGDLHGNANRPEVVQGLPKGTQNEAKSAHGEEKEADAHPKKSNKYKTMYT